MGENKTHLGKYTALDQVLGAVSKLLLGDCGIQNSVCIHWSISIDLPCCTWNVGLAQLGDFQSFQA